MSNIFITISLKSSSFYSHSIRYWRHNLKLGKPHEVDLESWLLSTNDGSDGWFDGDLWTIIKGFAQIKATVRGRHDNLYVVTNSCIRCH